MPVDQLAGPQEVHLVSGQQQGSSISYMGSIKSLKGQAGTRKQYYGLREPCSSKCHGKHQELVVAVGQ